LFPLSPLLADLFLYSYESEFLQQLVKDKKIHEARAFNFTYRYIDDVFSINSMSYLFEFCLKNMWNCIPTQQILSHCFNDWKLCDFFLKIFLSSILHENFWFFNSIYHPTAWQIKNPLKRKKSQSFQSLKQWLKICCVGIQFHIFFKQNWVVYRVEKSKVFMEDTWEKDLDLRLSKRSLEFHNISVVPLLLQTESLSGE
jgi:hypothetical protein